MALTSAPSFEGVHDVKDPSNPFYVDWLQQPRRTAQPLLDEGAVLEQAERERRDRVERMRNLAPHP